MFNKNRKTKKSLLISTYECLILHYNFIENNNKLYIYNKKDKKKNKKNVSKNINKYPNKKNKTNTTKNNHKKLPNFTKN